MRTFVFSFIILSTVMLASCGNNVPTNRLQIAGSSTLAPLLEAILDAYTEERDPGRISVDVIGSGAGIRRLINAECHISSASRTMTTEELQAAANNGIDPIGIVVAMDAIALCTGGGVTGDVSFDELPTLLTADNWNAVRGNWPDHELTKYYPGTDSGTFDFLIDLVFDGDAGKLLGTGQLQLSEDDHVLVQGVKGDPWSLGFFGYSYYVAQQEALNLLSIDGRIPSDGAVYPLSRPLYLYFDRNQPNPEIRRLIDFTLDFAESGQLPEGFLHPGDSALIRGREVVSGW